MENKFKEFTDITELTSQFEIEFFESLDNLILDYNATVIKLLFMDGKYNHIRNFIEEKVEDRQLMCLIDDKQFSVDSENLKNYKSWKDIDNLFTEFYEVYTDLIELNII